MEFKNITRPSEYTDYDSCLVQFFDPITLYLIDNASVVEFMLINHADRMLKDLGLDTLPKPEVYDMLWRLGRMRHRGSSRELIENIMLLSSSLISNDGKLGGISSFFEMLTEIKYPGRDINKDIPIDPAKVTYVSVKLLSLYRQVTYGPFEYCTAAINDARAGPVVIICILLTSSKIKEYNTLFGVFDDISVQNVNPPVMIEGIKAYINRGVFTPEGRAANEKLARGDRNLDLRELLMLTNNNLAHYLGFKPPYTTEDLAKAYNRLYYKEHPVNIRNYKWEIRIPTQQSVIGGISIKDTSSNSEYIYTYGDHINSVSYTFEDIFNYLTGGKKMELPIGVTDEDFWNKQNLYPLAEEIRTLNLSGDKPRILKDIIYALPPSRSPDADLPTILETLNRIFAFYKVSEKTEYNEDSHRELSIMMTRLRWISQVNAEFLSTYKVDKCGNLLECIRLSITKFDKGENPYDEFINIEKIINALN